MMFNAITNWYVNYCNTAITWCATHPAVTAIALIVDMVVIAGCVAWCVFWGYKTFYLLRASKAKM